MRDRDPLVQLLDREGISAATELDAIDGFIGAQLAAAGEWASPRTSDGISQLRIVERSPARVTIAGQIWRIEQSLHAFWLVVTADPDGGPPHWTLYFDVDRELVSGRAARGAIDGDGPGDLAWRITLSNAPDAGDPPAT